MEQKIVKNVSNVEVAVMWDGFQVYFKPGQERVYTSGVADGISAEHESLEIVEQEVEEKPKAKKVVVKAKDEVVKEKEYQCKKCDFKTKDKMDLLKHYNKSHKK